MLGLTLDQCERLENKDESDLRTTRETGAARKTGQKTSLNRRKNNV